MVSKASLDALEKRYISCPCQESNVNSFAFSCNLVTMLTVCHSSSSKNLVPVCQTSWHHIFTVVLNFKSLTFNDTATFLGVCCLLSVNISQLGGILCL